MPSTRRTAVALAVLALGVSAPSALAKPPAGGSGNVTYSEGESRCGLGACSMSVGPDGLRLSATASGPAVSYLEAANRVTALATLPLKGVRTGTHTVHVVLHVRRAGATAEATLTSPLTQSRPEGSVDLLAWTAWSVEPYRFRVVSSGQRLDEQDVAFDINDYLEDSATAVTIGVQAVASVKPECISYGGDITESVLQVVKCDTEFAYGSASAEIDAYVASYSVT